ncbi:MAG: V-type ATP synthase subunit D [Nitrospirae bacterium]|nr:V-type ATP synthase subunit D [Nitrospirota bacterium]
MQKASPTRMNLLILKGQVESARKGLDLLRSKREALVREFFSTLDTVVASRDLLRSLMEGGMNSLAVALGRDGRAVVESAAFAAHRDIPVELVEKNIWGVKFPEIRHPGVIRSADARGYAVTGVSSYVNTAARDFERALDQALKIISVEMRLKKIGEEIKKTTRRINALTEIVLPELHFQIRSVRFALEEREREDIFRMKRFKEKHAAAEG